MGWDKYPKKTFFFTFFMLKLNFLWSTSRWFKAKFDLYFWYPNTSLLCLTSFVNARFMNKSSLISEFKYLFQNVHAIMRICIWDEFLFTFKFNKNQIFSLRSHNDLQSLYIYVYGKIIMRTTRELKSVTSRVKQTLLF